MDRFERFVIDSLYWPASSSKPIAFLFRFRAAISVDAEPAKGSNMVSPSLVWHRIMRSKAEIGLGVACFVPFCFLVRVSGMSVHTLGIRLKGLTLCPLNPFLNWFGSCEYWCSLFQINFLLSFTNHMISSLV